MITLKTLPQATAQEVFDQITQHLLTQGKAAKSTTGACRYRAETGKGVLKCAAGCLITEDEYSEAFEGKPWHWLINSGEVPKENSRLIRSLQIVHDTRLPSRWPIAFKTVADEFKLSYDHQLL